MAEFLHCPSCQRRLQAPPGVAGYTVQCPGCGTSFTASVDSDAPRPATKPVPLSPRWSDSPEKFSPPEDSYSDLGDEFPGPRRDLTPHRGSTILILGILSLLLCLIGVILGPFAWIMGTQDLKEIHAGRMDPEGEGPTNTGRLCGIVGTIMNLVCLGFLFLAAFFQAMRWQ
jgi:hypothetical protein